MDVLQDLLNPTRTQAPYRAVHLGKDLLPTVPAGTEMFAFQDPSAILAPGGVDSQRRCATFIVSTVSKDREGDVMEPRGCLDSLRDYERNSPWYYDHDYRKQGAVTIFPIGSCKGGPGFAGPLDLQVDQNQIIATCHWHDKTEDARDCWDLVEAGILKGASIGFVPIPEFAEKIGKDCYHFRKWRLTEISVTGLPANQDCLRVASLSTRESFERIKTLSASWSPGVTIPEPPMAAKKKTKQLSSIAFLKKLFTRTAAVKFLKAGGYDSASATSGEKEWIFPQTKSLAPAQLAKGVKAYTSDEEDDDDEDDGDDDVAADENATADKPKPKKEQPEPTDEPPPGAKTLAEIHQHHAGDLEASEGLKSAAEEMMKYNEHPMVRGHLQGIIDGHDKEAAGHQQKMDQIKDLAGKAYPDVDFDKLCAAGKPAAGAKDMEDGDGASLSTTTDSALVKPDDDLKKKEKALKGKAKSDAVPGDAPPPADGKPGKLCKACSTIVKALLDAPADETQAAAAQAEPVAKLTTKDMDDGDDGAGAKSLLAETGALRSMFSLTSAN